MHTLAAAKNKTSENVIFSNRHREILEYLSLGCTNQEIAHSLDLSINTVKTHLISIFRELDVENRTEAVHQYRQKCAELAENEPQILPSSIIIGMIGFPDGRKDVEILAQMLEDLIAVRILNCGRIDVVTMEDSFNRNASYQLGGHLHVDGRKIHLMVNLHRGEGMILWAHLFELSDLIEKWGGDVAGILVAATVQKELERLEYERIVMISERKRTAWEEFILGIRLLAMQNEEHCKNAMAAFFRSLEKNSNFMLAHYGMAVAYGMALLEQWNENAGWSRTNIHAHAKACAKLDPDSSDTLTVLSISKMIEGDVFAAEQLLCEAIRRNPCQVLALDLLAMVKVWHGDLETAHNVAGMASFRSLALPLRFRLHATKALIAFAEGKYADAISACREKFLFEGDGLLHRLLCVAANVQLGNMDAAKAAVDQLLKTRPNFHFGELMPVICGTDSETCQRFMSGIERAGLTR